MNQSDKSNLLMLCGALHDIAELLKWHPLGEKIKVIEIKIEDILLKH